jgi:ABC-type branched-subunit amino acid transport system ATPase component
MREPTNKKIQSLSLESFTAFEQVTFEFCPGINVLIGANSTGKTLTMKLMYAILKICQTLHAKNVHKVEPETQIFIGKGISRYGVIIDSKLQGVFQFQQVSDLIRADSSQETQKQLMRASLRYADSSINLAVEAKPDDAQKTSMSPFMGFQPGSLAISPSVIYLPSHEILSMNQGFISLYQNREIPYDETYYDLSVALNIVPLRSEKLDDVQNVLTFLEMLLTGEPENFKKPVVIQENNRFYFELPDGRFEAHLVAEGYRKIATVLVLLKNGALTKNSILFWDEPETNFNPKLIVQIVEVLKKLAATGMQIFITTHDYLLSHELSLMNEYQTSTPIDMKFFALHKPHKNEGVQVESGHTLAEIQENPILEEFAAHYDREATLFQQSNG